MAAAAAYFCAATLWAADWKTLRPQGYVSDFAGVVDAGSRKDLDAYCAALEHATGAHLSLVVIDSLKKEPAPDVARAILEAWSAGQSAPDDRALLLIAANDHRDSLVTGHALAQILNEDAEEDVLAEARPALARKQYGSALMAAADEIGGRIAAARGKTIGVRLPKRARRTWSDVVPWMLAAGVIPLLGLLVWLLRRPHGCPPREHA